jgi:hypothetical protein
MITNRNRQYFAGRKQRNAQPIKRKEDVQKSNDNKIDQDFPGFPHGHSKENIINPINEKDKRTADVYHQDGEKTNPDPAIDESFSDASGGAFEATERVKE